MEEDDHSEPGEQPIPPAFTDEVETEGQPATPIFTPSTDEGEQDEQAAPVDYHSGEIEEASSESAESEQGEEMEPEGEEQPIP